MVRIQFRKGVEGRVRFKDGESVRNGNLTGVMRTKARGGLGRIGVDAWLWSG